MGQSIWNFFWPTLLSAFSKMSGTTLEWALPVTPLLPISAGDPLSQDSLLQSLSRNLLTFCWGVKIPSLTPDYHASFHLHPHSQLLFLVDELLLLTNIGKNGPNGDFVPPCIVHVNVCPCWFGPSRIPLGVLERRPTAQCIDWLIKWKTLLAMCSLKHA